MVFQASFPVPSHEKTTSCRIHDKARWARISLYSDSEAPEDLAMPLVKRAGLSMKLDPVRGHLEFNANGRPHVLAIATPRDAKRTVCAKYSLRVIDASAKNAVVRRICNEHEFRPNRFLASVDYFIHDAETATMRSIWRNEITKQGSPLPLAKPVPVVRLLPNGYQFDWKSQAIGDAPEGPAEIHTSYLRNGAGNLARTDIAAPKGSRHRSGKLRGRAATGAGPATPRAVATSAGQLQMSTPKAMLMLLMAAMLLPTLAIAAPADREGMERVERLRNGGSDKERWSSVWLYSETTSASPLSMTVVNDAGTQMALDPAKGDITFTSKEAMHRFHLTAAKGEPKSPCPDYTVQILEASARHTLIQHTCNKTEYRPNKFHSSVDYFLYDLETASVRSIWANSASGKNAPLPSAEPNPKLKVVAGGYKFDWQPSKENRDGESQFERHMSFQRKLVGGKKELVCFDHTFPKNEAEGSGACAAQRLTRVDL